MIMINIISLAKRLLFKKAPKRDSEGQINKVEVPLPIEAVCFTCGRWECNCGEESKRKINRRGRN